MSIEEQTIELDAINRAMKETLILHQDKIMITKEGECIILASAVIGNIDENLTIF